MDIDEVGREPADSSETLFGLPTDPTNNVVRSREALFLRLEQMKINCSKPEPVETQLGEGKSSSISSPSSKARKSKAIPITKTNRTFAHNQQEARGFTDDMMFFAEGEHGNSHDSSNEPFVPPHLQHSDSFSIRSFA